MTHIKQKAILLLLLPCIVVPAFLFGCDSSEDRLPVTEPAPEYPAEENQTATIDLPPVRPDRPSEEEASLTEEPESGAAETAPTPAQGSHAGEYGRLSRDFVDTIAGILSRNDVAVSLSSIEELERVISVLIKTQDKIEADISPAPDELSEVEQCLADLRKSLGIGFQIYVSRHLSRRETGTSYSPGYGSGRQDWR